METNNQCPVQGIINKNIGNYSYAHSILQSLCNINTSK